MNDTEFDRCTALFNAVLESVVTLFLLLLLLVLLLLLFSVLFAILNVNRLKSDGRFFFKLDVDGVELAVLAKGAPFFCDWPEDFLVDLETSMLSLVVGL